MVWRRGTLQRRCNSPAFGENANVHLAHHVGRRDRALPTRKEEKIRTRPCNTRLPCPPYLQLRLPKGRIKIHTINNEMVGAVVVVELTWTLSVSASARVRPSVRPSVRLSRQRIYCRPVGFSRGKEAAWQSRK